MWLVLVLLIFAASAGRIKRFRRNRRVWVGAHLIIITAARDMYIYIYLYVESSSHHRNYCPPYHSTDKDDDDDGLPTARGCFVRRSRCSAIASYREGRTQINNNTNNNKNSYTTINGRKALAITTEPFCGHLGNIPENRNEISIWMHKRKRDEMKYSRNHTDWPLISI